MYAVVALIASTSAVTITHHIIEDGPMMGDIATKIDGEFVHPDHPVLLEMGGGMPKKCVSEEDKQIWADHACAEPTVEVEGKDKEFWTCPMVYNKPEIEDEDERRAAGMKDLCLHFAGKSGKYACLSFCVKGDPEDAAADKKCTKMVGKGPVGKCACNNVTLHCGTCEEHTECCAFEDTEEEASKTPDTACAASGLLQQKASSLDSLASMLQQ